MADKFVNVPEVLPDSLKDKVFDDPTFFGLYPYAQDLLWDGFKDNYAKIVAHFKANAPVSDDAKGLNFYRAIVDQEDPDWLPDQIYLKQDSEGPVQGVYFAAGAHKCRTDRTGRVALRAPVGGDWLLYPKQFRVITWKKNEAENGG